MKKPIWLSLGLTFIIAGGFFLYWKSVGPGSQLPPAPPRQLGDKEKAWAFFSEWDGMDAAARTAAVPDLVKFLNVEDEAIRLQVMLAVDKGGPHATGALIGVMTGATPDTRYYAIWGLGRLGPNAKAALPLVLGAALRDTNADVRRKSVWALGQIRPEAAMGVPVLVAVFQDRDVDVREAAADALGVYGKAAVPELTATLKGKEREPRRLALRALARVGPAAANEETLSLVGGAMLDDEGGLQDEAAFTLAQLGKPAIPLLAAAMNTDDLKTVPPMILTGFGSPWAMAALWRDPSVQRRRAIGALRRIGLDALEELVAALQSRHADVRAQAASILEELRHSDRRIIALLGDQLRDRDVSARQRAGSALVSLTTDARDALPGFQQALQDPDATIRVDAVAYLHYLGTPALPLLVAALKDVDARVQKQARSSLLVLPVDEQRLHDSLEPLLKDAPVAAREGAVAVMGRCGTSAVGTLIGALKDPEDPVRQAAIEALLKFKADEKVLLPALLEAVKDRNELVRAGAINALTRYSGHGLPKALAGLQDESPHVRAMSAKILGQYDLKVAPDLIGAMKDENRAVWEQSWKSLEKLPADNRKLLPLLAAALQDKNKDVKQGAAYAMKRFGGDAVPHLVQALKDPDANVREAAVISIDHIDLGARSARRGLIELLDETQPGADLRKRVIKALLAVQGLNDYRDEPARAVPGLVELLDDRDATTRWAACRTLAVIGPGAKDAIPALTKALKDDSQSVSASAAYALKCIKGEDKP